MSKPEDYIDVAKYLKANDNERIKIVEEKQNELNIEEKEIKRKMIKSSGDAREEFRNEQIKKYDKTKYAK